MPCIFNEVNVTLSTFIEATFKGVDYEFNIMAPGFEPKLTSFDTFYSKEWFYRLCGNRIVRDEKTGKECRRIELDETTQQLISLLNVKHALKQD